MIASRITMGPIPSADEMERYRLVQADFPERIMRQYEARTDMARKQGEHRMALESKVISNNVWMERLGWLSATLLGVLGLGGSIWLVYLGKTVGGIAGVITSLAALVGLYLYGKRGQVQEVTKKRAREMVVQGRVPPAEEEADYEIEPEQR